MWRGGSCGQHGGGLLLVVSATGSGSAHIGSGKTSDFQKPRGKQRSAGHEMSLLGEDDEDCLGDVIRVVRIVRLASGGGVDQIDVPVHQSAERIRRTRMDEIGQKLCVVRHHHVLKGRRRPLKKVDKKQGLFVVFLHAGGAAAPKKSDLS
jgi:hypothetical protein